jgi:ribonuclease D
MRDESMVELARAKPCDPAALRRVGTLSRSWREGRRGAELLAAVERGLSVPEDRLPEAPPRRRGRAYDPALESRVRRLSKERDRLAESLDLEPSVLASRAQLEELLAVGDRGAVPTSLRSWQAGLLRPIVEAAAP